MKDNNIPSVGIDEVGRIMNDRGLLFWLIKNYKMTGWIRLHRSITGHWIFKNEAYLKAWITMLLLVNYESKKDIIDGELIECYRGQALFSLSTWTSKFGKGWTIQKTRTFFNLLTKDNMIRVEGMRKTTRITICNYDSYQDDQQADNKQITSRQQADNKQITTTKESKEIKESKEDNIGEKSKRFIPPTLSDIIDYCLERKNYVDPEKWFNFYSAKNWMIGKNKMKDWRAAVRTWENNSSNNNSNYGNKTNTYIGGSKAINQDESLFCGVQH